MKPAPAVALLVALAGFAPEAQVVRYVDGIFVAPRTGAPVELIVRYDPMRLVPIGGAFGRLWVLNWES